MAIQDGDIVGDYRVIGVLGSGGMGTVYRIEHRISRRIEAMKLLPRGLASGPEQERRFEREIQFHARLQHPHIAALYNAVRQPDAIALIMEYVEGESLQQILERGPLPLDLAVRHTRQILDALAHGHREGVIHCDVSPANIVITRDGAAKLLDFGIARAATDLGLADAGVPAGSPWHMAPEQVKAVGELDGRADIYAMGAVLFEMLTGRKVFDAEGSFEVMRAHVETAPRPPSAYRRGVPKALDKAVLRALAKNPKERFRDASEFAAAVEKAVATRQSRATIPMAAAATLAALACGALLPRKQPEPILVAPPAPPAPVISITLPAADVAADPAPPPPKRKPTLRPRRQTAPATVRAPEEVTPRLPELPEMPTVRAEIPAPVAAPLAPLEEADPPAPAEEPRKAGNRFRRAIEKLNPFRKKS